MLNREDGREDRGEDGGEDGQLTLLVIGYAAIAAALVVVGVDVSAAFLARQALSAVADEAALAAVQAVDRGALYAGGVVSCEGGLPLDATEAAVRARAAVAARAQEPRPPFLAVETRAVVVSGGTATVELRGRARVPFGRLLAVLLPGHDDGAVTITVTAHARDATC